MIKTKSRMEKLTIFQDSCLETVNIEELTKKAKIIHKNCPNKMNNHLSITDRTGPMNGFLALGEKNLRPVLKPLKIRYLSITDRIGPMSCFLALGEKNLRPVLKPLKIR